MTAQKIESRHTGSCLCKTVQYQVQGQLSTIALCHCENCAKASGSNFMSNWWFEKGVSRTIYSSKNFEALSSSCTLSLPQNNVG